MVEVDVWLHGSLPKLRADCGKTQQTPAPSVQREGRNNSKDINSGRRRWTGWGKAVEKSRREFSVAVVLMSLCSGCHKRDRGLSVLTGHQAVSLPARK